MILQDERFVSEVAMQYQIAQKTFSSCEVPYSSEKLFIKKIPTSVTTIQFLKYFSQFGTVFDYIVIVKNDSRKYHFGYCEYVSIVDENSLKERKFELNQEEVIVKLASPENMIKRLRKRA